MIKVTRTEEYLAHHGIKGQKWGVRNGPPYPLKEGAHSSAEKKAGGPIATAILGGIAAHIVALAAAYAAVKLSVDAADKRKTKQYNEEYYQKRKDKTLNDVKRINPESMSMSKHMATINQDYPKTGTTQNCMFCTTAMAMRMKGYDVVANKCPDGWSNNNLESTWTGYKMEQPKAKNAVELTNYLTSQGDGAYGNLVVFWTLGGGHSLFYHVDNGKVKIYDTQANKEHAIDDFNGTVIIPTCQVTRLDNCEPTEMVLGAVKSREGKKKS